MNRITLARRKTPIMNFDLKKLDLEAAAHRKIRPAALFWCQRSSSLAGMSCRPWWRRRSTGTSAPRLANACSAMGIGSGCKACGVSGNGDGSARAVRQAVLSLLWFARKGHRSSAWWCCSSPLAASHVGVAVQAVAEASYVYTTTKSKAEARALTRCVVGVADVAAARANLMPESLWWRVSNWPAKSGRQPPITPPPPCWPMRPRLLAKQPRVQCKVHGPGRSGRAGHGSFHGGCPGTEQPLRLLSCTTVGQARMCRLWCWWARALPLTRQYLHQACGRNGRDEV